MADLGSEIIQLGLYQSKAIVPLRTFSPGVYTQRMTSQGNSLLSTLFVESADFGATIDIEYFDSGVGGDVGEHVTLGSHIQPAAPGSDRILVTRLHDKPTVKITVAGGNIRAGIYLSVVSSFASDLDSALKTDATTAMLEDDKGMPIMLLDPVANKFFFVRGEGGSLPVFVFEGEPHQESGSDLTTPGIEQTIISVTVPASKLWKMRDARVVCRAHGTFVILIDGVLAGSGRTGPGQPNGKFPWSPFIRAEAGQLVEIKFLETVGPECDLEAYLAVTVTDV